VVAIEGPLRVRRRLLLGERLGTRSSN
jgi:hypothetical protein